MSNARGGLLGFCFAASLVPALTPSVAADFLVPIAVDQAGHVAGPILDLGRDADYDDASVIAELQPGQPPNALGTYGHNIRGSYGYFYHSKDCSGTRFVRVDVPSYAGPSERYPALLFFPDPKAPAKLVSTQSYDGDAGKCVSYKVPPQLAAPAKYVTIKSLGFATRGVSVSLAVPTRAGRPFAADNQGKVIGPVFGEKTGYGLDRYVSDYNYVVIRLKPTNVLVSLGISRTGFDSEYKIRYYRSRYCRGDAYVPASDKLIRRAYVGYHETSKIYYPESDVISLKYRSYSYEPGKCINKNEEGPYPTNRLASVSIDAQGFTTPFNITLH